MLNHHVATFDRKLRAAIIGTGNIGMDVLMKLQKSSSVHCSLFIGRNPSSENLRYAQQQGIMVSSDSINALSTYQDDYDIVFDATSALDHIEHAKLLNNLGKKTIDLTPAKIGEICVPAINIDDMLEQNNINMVTCGGQAAIPICHALSTVHKNIPYIEIVSSISSKSAGPATRLNLDEYILTTEQAVIAFSGALEAKAILNINPAVPHVSMKTTIFAHIDSPNLAKITDEVIKMISYVQCYTPQYKLMLKPYFDGQKIIITLEVTGAGDYLPSFAGNLDIITSAAVYTAEKIALYEQLKMEVIV